MPEPIQTPEEGTEQVPSVTAQPGGTDQPPQPKPEETVDFWKDKFSASSSEANLLREAEAARKKAEQESTKEPTDSELRAAFPEWDSLSDFEKGIARRQVNTERIAAASARTSAELAAKDSWNASIQVALTSNDSLQGREQAFRQFASKPQYRGAPMELIVNAFLGKQPAQADPRPTPRPGLEPGSGGPKAPERPKTLSAEELKTLRKTDEKAYTEYIRTHDIDVDDI